MRDFERVFADHADYPTSICHHEDPRDPQHARLGTVISFVMNLNTREMHICKGAPCETPFEVRGIGLQGALKDITIVNGTISLDFS